jgi:RimJ/RimL family protein N-acetyltransferase
MGQEGLFEKNAERYDVRALTSADAQDYFELGHSNPDDYEMVGDRSDIFDVSTAQKALDTVLADGSQVFGTFQNNKLVGVILARRPRFSSGLSRSLASFVDVHLQGKGLNTEALKICMSTLKSQGVQELVCHIDKENTASLRSAEKAGFLHDASVNDGNGLLFFRLKL